MAAAIPLVSTGISLYQGWRNSRNQAKAQKAADAAAAPGFAGLRGAADQLTGEARATSGFGRETLGRSTSYYDKLLNGNKAELTGALAPEIGATNELYRGASRAIDRTAPGASRDVQQAELARERVGKIGSLVSGVRPMAANALTGIGQNTLSQGLNAQASAGGIYAQLLDGLNAKRDLDMRQGAQNDANNTSLWSNIGRLLVQSYSAYSGRSNGLTIPQMSVVPAAGA